MRGFSVPLLLIAAVGVSVVALAVNHVVGDAYQSKSVSNTENVLSSHELPAFPGAEGFGANAMGGRGGTVMKVTSLNDSGPGTLRECVDFVGPRICVFTIGGTITLQSELEIDSPYITIAGQTAAGDGITIRNDPGNVDPSIEIQTHNVIIRGIRVRTGPSTALATDRRGISIEKGAHSVIIDHSSISWATDENVTMIDGVRDITIQWSIISEALSNSTHAEGEHSKGMLISGKNYTNNIQTGNISVHHNLFAHNFDRNPRNAGWEVADVVNNVMYNYGNKAAQATDSQTQVPMNIIKNYFIEGVDSNSPEVQVSDGEGVGARLYVEGNIGPNRPNDSDPEENIVHVDDRVYIVPIRFTAPSVSETSALQAYNDVLDKAGVIVPVRDSVDQRVISDVRNLTGNIIDDPSEVGGWPNLSQGVVPTDTDNDGMPDDWELARGLDININDSASDRDGDGYTNIEEYINGLFGDGGGTTPPPPPDPEPDPDPEPPPPPPSGDTTPPVVVVTSPLDGDVVERKSNVTISAVAFDDVSVDRVEFYVDGSLRCTDTVAPYNCDWNVPGKAGATYHLGAIGFDTSNNYTVSEMVVVSTTGGSSGGGNGKVKNR